MSTLFWGGLALLAAALSQRVMSRMRRRRDLMRRGLLGGPIVCRRGGARN
jgi:hypothetical protein